MNLKNVKYVHGDSQTCIFVYMSIFIYFIVVLSLVRVAKRNKTFCIINKI